MSWLRIDDSFTDHPKIISLGPVGSRWAFLELLGYCAKHRTGGYFPATIGDTHRRITPALIARCIAVGLVDEADDGELRVHDFQTYNPPTKDPTGAVRQQRWRNANRNGDVTVEVTASRARDPVPYPNPEEQEQEPTAASPRKRDAVWDFVVTIEGEPLPRHRAGRGRIVSDLRTLLSDEPPDELERRHEALAREWGDSKATARALVQHWHRAGEIANGHARPPRPPSGKFSADDLYLQAQQHQRDRNGGPELGTG